MKYKVLYRKYRPDSFDSIVGQENVVKILKNSIKHNKISHAYIFSGSRGTGKTSSAKIFARAVNCLNQKAGLACEKCINCLNGFDNNDIIEIDAASNNGVNEIREIINNIKLLPNLLKYKVYIIDEVHMLSQSAFNALLLTLEEPPSHVIFILATTNIESVPITILSRCQRFDFKKIKIEDIEKQLTNICQKENIKITSEAINEIAYLADGGLRDALSLLDQLSKDEKEITLNDVTLSVGNISSKNVEEILNLLENNETVKLIKKFNELNEMNIDYKLIIKNMIDVIAKKVRDILLDNSKSKFAISEYKNMIFDLTDCMNKINVNVNAYNMLSVVLLNYIKKDNFETQPKEDLISKNLRKKEHEKDDIRSLREIRINNCFAEATKEEKKLQSKSWEEFIKDVDNKIKGLIFDSEVVLASKKIILIMVELKYNIDELNKMNNKIADLFNKINNTSLNFVFISKNDWKKETNEYLKKIKCGEKYNLIEEIEVECNELNDIADNIFSKEKIEER